MPGIDAGEPISSMAASFYRDLRAIGRTERTITIYEQAIRFYRDWLLRPIIAAGPHGGHGWYREQIQHEQGTRSGNVVCGCGEVLYTPETEPTTAADLTRENIKGWMASLAEAGLEGGTRHTRFASLRRFCRWAVAEDILAKNPMEGMEAPVIPPKPVPVFTDAEIAALIKACQGTRFPDRRDEAIIRILDDTGMRISECTHIALDELDLDRRLVLIHGKGNRDRIVAIGVKTTRVLDRYIRARRTHRFAESGALWLGERGPLTRDGIDDMLRARARLAGVRDVHAHRFRHTLSHQWLASGGLEGDLMQNNGWSSREMLSRYGASVAAERAQDAHRRLRRDERL